MIEGSQDIVEASVVKKAKQTKIIDYIVCAMLCVSVLC